MEQIKKTYNPNLSSNLIVNMTFEFALQIIRYSELLESTKKFTISKQIIRRGTSIGANVREAQNAESKADFIHKMKISAKEADETEYWLLLCQHNKNYPKCEGLLIEILRIKKILSKIISSSKRLL